MSRYAELGTVTQVLLEQDLSRHRDSLEVSRRINGELAQIDAMRAAAQADVGAISARQILGADTLWQGWMVAKRAEIQRRAATARAVELETLARAKLAHSRAEAAKDLIKREKSEKKRIQDMAMADRIEELGRLKTALRMAAEAK